jgi:putative copper export protein
MLAPAIDAIRLSLHILAAAVWVGGQITMLALVPTARGVSGGAPRTLANAFARISWPAYAVLVLTGLWNIAATHPSQQSTAWEVVLGVKIAVVALAGAGALFHQRARSSTALAVWGTVAGLASTAALVMGVLLAGGSLFHGAEAAGPLGHHWG